jgi:hypothetical protein
MKRWVLATLLGLSVLSTGCVASGGYRYRNDYRYRYDRNHDHDRDRDYYQRGR